MSADFDLHNYLQDWRQEQREDLANLNERIEDIRTRLSDHNTRLTMLEGMAKSVKWLTVTVVGALITAVVGYFNSWK